MLAPAAARQRPPCVVLCCGTLLFGGVFALVCYWIAVELRGAGSAAVDGRR